MEFHAAQEGKGLKIVIFSFTGKSHKNIRAEGHIGNGPPDKVHFFQISVTIVAPIHKLQDS